MPPHFPSFLSSRTFEVQSRDRSFFVHGDILASQSEPLRRATANSASEKNINLSHWDSGTVERFLQFLYVGDYQVPETTEDEADEDEGGSEGSGRDGEVDTPDTLQSLAIQEEQELGCVGVGVNILLVHAKVYTIAYHMGVGTLQSMALERLRTSLKDIGWCSTMLKATSRVVSHIMDLVVYVYSSNDYPAGPEEPIRDLVSSFTAENVENLMCRAEVTHLLRGGGDFPVELVEKLIWRLCDGKKACGMEGLCDMDTDTDTEIQQWKNRVVVADEKVRNLEAANAEIQQSESASVEKLQQMERKLRQSEATSAATVRVLEDKVRQSEAINAARIRQLKVANAEKLQHLELANAVKVRGLVEKMERLEAKTRDDVRLLETINAEKMRESEAAHAEKVRLLQLAHTEKLLELENKVRHLEYPLLFRQST